MREGKIVFCKIAAVGIISGVILCLRAEAVPLAIPANLALAAAQAKLSQAVPYICRRDTYGRTCTYVSSADRNVRSDRSRTYGGSPYYQAQPYSGSSGYYPFYWANPQGSD
jgi:hypothetical protein